MSYVSLIMCVRMCVCTLSSSLSEIVPGYLSLSITPMNIHSQILRLVHLFHFRGFDICRIHLNYPGAFRSPRILSLLLSGTLSCGCQVVPVLSFYILVGFIAFFHVTFGRSNTSANNFRISDEGGIM